MSQPQPQPIRIITLDDIGTRIRVSSTSYTTIEVQVDAEGATPWPDGAWVEVVYLGTFTDNILISTVPLSGVILHQLSGTLMLVPGQYCRLTRVSMDVWDVQVYPKIPATTQGSLLLASSGTGSGCNWVPAPAGAPPTYVFEVENISSGSSGSFGGSLFNSWGGVNFVAGGDSPPITWDNYSHGFKYTGSLYSYFEVFTECEIKGYDGYSLNLFPEGLSAYGIDLEAVYPALNRTPQTKTHTRFSNSSNTLSEGNFGLSVGSPSAVKAANTCSFTERFIVSFEPNSVVVPRLFAYNYNAPSIETRGRVVISFRFIGEYSPA